MADKVVIALDLGTTGNRAIAFRKDGSVAAKSYYEFPQIYPQAGWVEHNPFEILETTLRALKDVLAVVGAANVVSIGMTNQRETTILWDRNTGKPVYNAIVWQDRRTEPICRALKKYAPGLKKKTGLFLDPYFSATKIKWLLDHVPGLKKSAARGGVIFGTPETWVLWNLTGRKIHATEPSNASRTMLMDLKTLRFDPAILKIFKIPAAILPEIKPSNSIFGKTDAALTGTEIPIAGILGDQQAALFAHAGWEKGVVKSTYGTGIFVLTSTGEKLFPSKTLIHTVAWQIDQKVNYAIEGSIFMGGAAIQWLRDNLKIIENAPDSEPIAAALDDNEGIYFVPAFQGLGAPYWDANARGVLIGLSRKASRENIVRAVVESLAYQTRDVVDEIQKISHCRFKTLRVDGGAAMNNFLMQFQSDLLDVTIERPNFLEITALGAAGISAIASGFWTRGEFKAVRKVDRSFSPSANAKKVRACYPQWQEAVRRSLCWNRP